ncbi:sulfurtransferase TusA family protein [Gammaproteobacteria bacterium]|jgi:tRNA 2-thiouridine synthesizing protein A|nr:sulfurtransferase TusA family protein [Gammaproteobacteria bacterium]
MNEVVDVELDLSGLVCPLPLLKTKQALNRMESGQKIKVLATDPGSERDFQVFAEQSGNKLLEMQQLDSQFQYLLQKR